MNRFEKSGLLLVYVLCVCVASASVDSSRLLAQDDPNAGSGQKGESKRERRERLLRERRRSGGASTPAAAEPERVPAPSPANVASRLELVRDVFKAEYEATDAKSRLELARRLLREARTEPEAATRYVLLSEAIELGVVARDVAVPLESVAAIAREFEVDELAMTQGVLARLSSGRDLPDDEDMLGEAWETLIDRAVEIDKYELAARAANELVALAKKSGDDDAENRATARLEALDKLKRAYLDLGPPLVRLQSDEADPAANAAVGSFYCLLKGDWERGLPYLAKGSDSSLATAARIEIEADSDDARASVDVADAWWNLAESTMSDDAERSGTVRRHAVEIYRSALPKLAGLLRTKVERRLEEFEPEVGDTTETSETPPELQVFVYERTRASPRLSWTPYPLSRIPTAKKKGVLFAKNTTGIYKEALLGTTAEYRGDFIAKLTVAGASKVGLVSERQGLAYASLKTMGWQEIVIERVDRSLKITVNGKEVQPIGRDGDRMSGHVFIAVEAKKQCAIRSFEVEDRDARRVPRGRRRR